MVHGVVAHGVAFVHHPAHQIRVAFQIMPHQKEAGGHFVFFQYVQNLCSMSVLIASVECQVQNRFFCIAQIGRIKLLQGVRAGRARRGSARVLKGQPPAPRFDYCTAEYGDEQYQCQRHCADDDDHIHFFHFSIPPVEDMAET